MPYKIYHIDLPYVNGLSFMVVAAFKEPEPRLTAEWFLAIPDDVCTFDGDRVVPTQPAGTAPVQHDLLNQERLLDFVYWEARNKLWAYERDSAAKQGRVFKAPAMVEHTNNFFVSYWFRGRCLAHIGRIRDSTLLPTLREYLELVATLPTIDHKGI